MRKIFSKELLFKFSTNNLSKFLNKISVWNNGNKNNRLIKIYTESKLWYLSFIITQHELKFFDFESIN